MVKDLLSALFQKPGSRLKAGELLTVQDKLRDDQLRILLFADAFGPTAQINWSRPLDKARHNRDCALWLIEEKQFERYAAAGGVERLRAYLGQIISDLRPDVVVASRYGGSSSNTIVDIVGKLAIPLIFHIDDNLLAVPAELGAAKVEKYGAPERLAAIRKFLTKSDLVYVSTAALLNQLIAAGAKPRRAFVGNIAGGVDIVAADRVRRQSRVIKIGYMASSSHNHDLMPILPVLDRILGFYKDVEFELFGSIKVPPELEGKCSRHHAPISNYNDFIEKLARLDWDIALAPLRLTEFNLAKTNTKWIECTAAGIPFICSHHPVYAEIGAAGAALLADSNDDWYEALSSLIESPVRRSTLLMNAQTLLREKFTLGHLQQQVANVLGDVGLAKKAKKLL